MRRDARIDSNQPSIVETLRGVGASVHCTHMVGDGFGDIVVGFLRVNYLAEIKDGTLPPSKRKLTPDEKKFHGEWQGTIHILESDEDALRMIGLIK